MYVQSSSPATRYRRSGRPRRSVRLKLLRDRPCHSLKVAVADDPGHHLTLGVVQFASSKRARVGYVTFMSPFIPAVAWPGSVQTYS